MKFYSFHIGDYLTAAHHLSWDENAAYRRLLDTYYATEKPFPPDLGKVCRLVKAATKRQREAVSVVLHEFFELTPDGWTNDRADAEICIMREKQSDQADKEENESDRMHRYRARRAGLFAALREVGIVPPYNIPMKDLVRMADENCNVPDAPAVTATVTPATQAVTLPATPVTPPATAIFTNTNTNTNTNTKTHTAVGDQPPGEPSGPVCVLVCQKMQEAGIGDTNASDKVLGVLVEKGADVAMFVDAATVAVGKKKGFAYAVGIVQNKMTAAAALANTAMAVPQQGVPARSKFDPEPARVSDVWHESAGGVDRMAAELGLPPIGPFEQWPSFRARVLAAAANKPPMGMDLSQLSALAAASVGAGA